MESTNVSVLQQTDVQQSKCGNMLLADGRDFMLSRVKQGYSERLCVTYRSPREVKGQQVFVIQTDTIDALSLMGLRVEELDGRHFVINDENLTHVQTQKLCVENEEVGQRMIRAIIEEIRPFNEVSGQKLSGIVPQKVVVAHNVVKAFAESILLSCAVILTISASYWFVFS